MQASFLHTSTAPAQILGGLGRQVRAFAAQWMAARERRAVYRRTYVQLNAMSDRGLADLGFRRDTLRGVARAAAARGDRS